MFSLFAPFIFLTIGVPTAHAGCGVAPWYARSSIVREIEVNPDFTEFSGVGKAVGRVIDFTVRKFRESTNSSPSPDLNNNSDPMIQIGSTSYRIPQSSEAWAAVSLAYIMCEVHKEQRNTETELIEIWTKQGFSPKEIAEASIMITSKNAEFLQSGFSELLRSLPNEQQELDNIKIMVTEYGTSIKALKERIEQIEKEVKETKDKLAKTDAKVETIEDNLEQLRTLVNEGKNVFNKVSAAPIDEKIEEIQNLTNGESQGSTPEQSST
jgi:hypothetical protein